MNRQVTLSIPTKLHQKVSRVARHQQRSTEDVLVDLLTSADIEAVLTENSADKSEISIPTASQTQPYAEAMQREKAAFLKMHSQLLQTHPNQSVAIKGGELIDYDADFNILYERVQQQFPNQFVWITTVDAEPIKTIWMRSPRLKR